MIIVKLMGGLGNQMFQYAIGKFLAIRNKTNLKLDISLYQTKQKGMTKRKYELDCFVLGEYSFASVYDLFWIENKRIKKLLKRALPIYRWMKVIKERAPGFNASVLNLPDNVCLDGYWNSEKYFVSIKDHIIRGFTFKGQISSKNKELLVQITSVESVGLHIRRGDYADDHKTKQCHGLCGMDYYFRAIEEISSKVQNPHFFVFSDDIEWVKNNLKIQFPIVFIDHYNELEAYEDMRLMSKCKHNIIANSTFSWWAAWLNENPYKIVIAPQNWFSQASLDAKDIIPNGWLKL